MEKIIILDFGSQYTQLIARRIRELNTYCEILPYNKFPFGDPDIKGVILSGSPFSVNDANAFKPDLSEIRGHYPLLGICYGAQYLAQVGGGVVGASSTRRYAPLTFPPISVTIRVDGDGVLDTAPAADKAFRKRARCGCRTAIPSCNFLTTTILLPAARR